jgi:hypothetical protein
MKRRRIEERERAYKLRKKEDFSTAKIGRIQLVVEYLSNPVIFISIYSDGDYSKLIYII